jgi:hypothetical protein
LGYLSMPMRRARFVRTMGGADMGSPSKRDPEEHPPLATHHPLG